MKLFSNVVVIFIVMIIAFIIIPLPAFFLDFMFIVSISASLIILLTTMFIKGPLEFSIFPSMLLITTLLRLALNISSTRLILGNRGQAGKVIETFGTFVLGGNAVVGFIVFVIIFIVQFIVITKGAERIAEVSARFTLDAMPGKQMAIDADLSSGLISEDEAKERRKTIQREAEFFGAMDGATKLVKGDAIAAIIIAVVNLIGGTIMGMVQGGMEFSQVLSVYSIATVGDGLVSDTRLDDLHIGGHDRNESRFGRQPEPGREAAVCGPAQGPHHNRRSGYGHEHNTRGAGASDHSAGQPFNRHGHYIDAGGKHQTEAGGRGGDAAPHYRRKERSRLLSQYR